jgi:hypothetical protein
VISLEKCAFCNKEIGLAKAEGMYYNGNYYRGHAKCIDKLEIELKYPRHTSM